MMCRLSPYSTWRHVKQYVGASYPMIYDRVNHCAFIWCSRSADFAPRNSMTWPYMSVLSSHGHIHSRFSISWAISSERNMEDRSRLIVWFMWWTPLDASCINPSDEHHWSFASGGALGFKTQHLPLFVSGSFFGQMQIQTWVLLSVVSVSNPHFWAWIIWLSKCCLVKSRQTTTSLINKTHTGLLQCQSAGFELSQNDGCTGGVWASSFCAERQT